MPHVDQMREHATRLLAMALTVRDKGQIEYADRLTEQASDVLDTWTPSGQWKRHSNSSVTPTRNRRSAGPKQLPREGTGLQWIQNPRRMTRRSKTALRNKVFADIAPGLRWSLLSA
jgi:hypothetical protein